MPLPVLQGAAAVSSDALIRLFHRATLDWSRHLGEEVELSGATGIINSQFARVHQANRVFDAALPAGTCASDFVTGIEEAYRRGRSRCGGFVLNPTAERPATEPIGEELIRRGYRSIETQIMLLRKVGAANSPRSLADMTVIPARASFRHYRELAEESARKWEMPDLADAAMLHLDDPRYDALLVLDANRAVATIGVLSMGEAGVIQDVFVVESHRGRGVGRLLMSRALEICARSSFKYVLLDVDSTNEPAMKLYEPLGFVQIGSMTRFVPADG